MVETGNNGKKRRTDASYKSFICALLAFLAMIILISLLLFALRNRSNSKSDQQTGRDMFNSDFQIGNTSVTETTTEPLTTTFKHTTLRPFPTTTLKESTENPSSSTEAQAPTTITAAITTTEKATTTTTEKATTTVQFNNNFPEEVDETTTPHGETTTEITVIRTKGKKAPGVPSTCQAPVCKRAASTLLATMDHDDKIDRCDDYYKFICDGPEKNDEHSFFHNSFKGFVSTIKEVTDTSEQYMQYFSDFYKSCVDFGNSIHRIERLNFLKGTETTTITDAVIKLVLTQTLPFFDIGLNIYQNQFIFQITLPGLGYLKTSLENWSLMDQLKIDCIEEQTDKLTQYVIDLNKISSEISTCIAEKAKKYVTEFVEEMKQLSTSPTLKFLEDNVNAVANPDDLVEIFIAVQEGLTAYRSTDSENLTRVAISDLKTNIDFGLDWMQLFKGISKDVEIEETTPVYLSGHLDGVFKKLKAQQANLPKLLDLWYNVELYKNTVVEKQIDNRGFHCMELTSQLMPEVSAFIISELNKDQKELYDETQKLSKNLTVNVYESVRNANMTLESSKIIQDRLAEISLVMPLSVDVDGINYMNIYDFKDPYQKKLTSLISNFRKTLYSLDQTLVSGDIFQKFFVNAFATKPKSFPPSRYVVFQPGFVNGISMRLPTYVKIAKLGLPLLEQIALHFTRNDYPQHLKPHETAVYEDMLKTFDTKYLINNVNYTVENIDIVIDDPTGNHLSYETIFADNMALRVDTDTFLEDESLEHLPFMQDFSRNESFIITALQEYCHQDTLVDFISDYYDRILPAPVKMKNMVKNSEFYAITFSCTDQFERKQFPYITVT